MLSNAEQQEILRRRTFAIISHPDAGKTTLTEKLLLYGGAIHVAGAVKSNKIRKTATSDWMEIEKQRGISVATSVMGFDYNNYHINILDTPGHQDFAEDTFRTLTAVDSVVIVIDSAKGVETQTRRLMQVCRMRKTPVMVFVNKMDREGKDPFDLMDEVESELGIHVRPLSWPINSGERFKGVYNIFQSTLDLYTPNKTQVTESIRFEDVSDPQIADLVGDADAMKLQEDLEMIEIAKSICPDNDAIRNQEGKLLLKMYQSHMKNPKSKDYDLIKLGVKDYTELFSKGKAILEQAANNDFCLSVNLSSMIYSVPTPFLFEDKTICTSFDFVKHLIFVVRLFLLINEQIIPLKKYLMLFAKPLVFS